MSLASQANTGKRVGGVNFLVNNFDVGILLCLVAFSPLDTMYD